MFDVLPHLVDIIQPNLRPVNTQLYSAREKEELKDLVDVMKAYSLTYVQERTPEGQYNYRCESCNSLFSSLLSRFNCSMLRLDPAVEDVACFPATATDHHFQLWQLRQRRRLPYAMRQLVAREIEMEKMRIEEKGRVERSSTGNARKRNSPVSNPEPEKTTEEAEEKKVNIAFSYFKLFF